MKSLCGCIFSLPRRELQMLMLLMLLLLLLLLLSVVVLENNSLTCWDKIWKGPIRCKILVVFTCSICTQKKAFLFGITNKQNSYENRIRNVRSCVRLKSHMVMGSNVYWGKCSILLSLNCLVVTDRKKPTHMHEQLSICEYSIAIWKTLNIWNNSNYLTINFFKSY